MKKTHLKWALALLMLLIVYRSVDSEALYREFTSLPPMLLVLVVLGYAASMVVSSCKWYLLATASGIETSLMRTLRASFLGMYVNCFGLGTVGGDITRGLLLTADRKDKSLCFASVVADRCIGLAVLALVGILAAVFFHFGDAQSGMFITAALVVLVVLLAWMFGIKVAGFLTGWNPKLRDFVLKLGNAFPRNPAVVTRVGLVALAFHLIQITLVYVLLTGLGAEVPWRYVLYSVPFINIASTLPLTWMGIGVRENAYVFFFVPAFITHEQAVLASAIWLTAITASSLLGGLLAVLTGDLSLLGKFNKN